MSNVASAERVQGANGYRGRVTRGPVVLATDGVEPGDAALRIAQRIAARWGVPVQPVAVARTTATYPAWSALPVAMPAYEAGLRQQLQAKVVRRLSAVLDASVASRVDVRVGIPADVINDVAGSARASLIVVGRGPQGLLDRIGAEDVALHVTRGATVPVLAVDDGAGDAIRRVVVGMDFGAASIRAAQAALELVDRGAPAAVVVSLVHTDARLGASPRWSRNDWSEYRSRVAELFARVRGVLAPYLPDGAILETRTSGGDTFEALLDTAIELEADLLAVGTRGAGWLDRVLVGSVATTVLRHGRRSVLVAPPPTPVERVRLELQVTGHVSFHHAEEWASALDAFTHRNASRVARLEAVGAAFDGLAVVSTGAVFSGAAYDPRDRRVDLMLHTPAGTHLTHTVTRVRSISIGSVNTGHDLTLAIEHGDGELVLVFPP